jgi:hypothetical protein
MRRVTEQEKTISKGDLMKTARQLADEIRASDCEYVTYGDSDIGNPVPKEEAILDIESMDDEMIGDGTWYECDSNGNVAS